MEANLSTRAMEKESIQDMASPRAIQKALGTLVVLEKEKALVKATVVLVEKEKEKEKANHVTMPTWSSTTSMVHVVP